MASPMNVIDNKVRNKASKGVAMSHQFSMLLRPCCINCPQLGVGGGNPNPRKSSDTREKIFATIAKGA